MKKLVFTLLTVVILFLLIVCSSYLFTNSVIDNSDYHKYPQWVSSEMWKIRDVFFECSTEAKILRTISYGTPSLLNNIVEEDIAIPDFTGHDAIDVIYNLKKLGYEISIKYVKSKEYDENQIVFQTPNGGTIIKPGDSIEFTLEDSWGNSYSNKQSGGNNGAYAVTHGESVYYYDENKRAIIKTEYDFNNSIIIYSGDASNLSAIDNCLYFYSFDEKAILELDIMTNEVRMILEGDILQFAIFDNYIYYTDRNNNLSLNRVIIGEQDSSVLLNEPIWYFDVKQDSIYYYCVNKYEDIRLNKIDLNGQNSEIILNEPFSDFCVIDKDIYFLSNYRNIFNIPTSDLYMINMDTGHKSKIKSNVVLYLIKDQYKFFINERKRVIDNRSIKGLLGIKTDESYMEIYIVGNKILLMTLKDEWRLFNDEKVIELE